MAGVPTDVPMTKARKMELSRRPFAMVFAESMARIEKDLCGECAMPIKANEFKDDKSRREYNISGVCQACQDKTFCTAADLEDEM